jgi:hypothetical protein
MEANCNILLGNSYGDVYRLQAIDDRVVLGHEIRMQVEQRRNVRADKIKGDSQLGPRP